MYAIPSVTLWITRVHGVQPWRLNDIPRIAPSISSLLNTYVTEMTIDACNNRVVCTHTLWLKQMQLYTETHLHFAYPSVPVQPPQSPPALCCLDLQLQQWSFHLPQCVSFLVEGLADFFCSPCFVTDICMYMCMKHYATCSVAALMTKAVRETHHEAFGQCFSLLYFYLFQFINPSKLWDYSFCLCPRL